MSPVGSSLRVGGRAGRWRVAEVERRLAERGLLGAGTGGFHGAFRAGPPRAWAADLARVLEDLGPVFTAFGQYLGGRADLFRVSDATALGSASSAVPRPVPGVLRRQIARELGAAPEALFARFDHEPASSTLLFHEHRAVLPDGRSATVRFLRPELEAELAEGIAALSALEPALHPLVRRDGWMAEAVDRFREELERAADLGRTARELDRFAASRRLEVSGVIPAVVRRLSTPRLLTTVSLPGAPVLDADDDSRVGEHAARLLEAWSTQVFFEIGFALDPDRALVLPDGRIGLPVGSLGSLSPESSERFLEYLVAVASRDMERASRALAAMTNPEPSEERLRELHRGLRTAVPLRVDPEGARPDGLLTEVLTHGAVLGTCGLRPGRELADIYRALLSVRRVLAGGRNQRDPMADAVRNVLLRLGWDRSRALLSPDGLIAWFSRNAAAFVSLPKALDRVLDRSGAAPRDPFPAEPAKVPAPGRRAAYRSGVAVTAVLLGGLIALTQMPRELLGERAAATAVFVLGVALVRILGGSR